MQCLLFHFTLQHHKVAQHAEFFSFFTLQFHNVAQHAVSYFPAVNTSVSRGVFSLTTSHFSITKQRSMQYLISQQLTLKYHAVTFIFHFTLQYHKVAQHAVSYFPAVDTSVSRGVFFVPLHTSVSHSSETCGVFFCHFTLQYHKVAQHAVSFFFTSHFSITK